MYYVYGYNARINLHSKCKICILLHRVQKFYDMIGYQKLPK